MGSEEHALVERVSAQSRERIDVTERASDEQVEEERRTRTSVRSKGRAVRMGEEWPSRRARRHTRGDKNARCRIFAADEGESTHYGNAKSSEEGERKNEFVERTSAKSSEGPAKPDEVVQQ